MKRPPTATALAILLLTAGIAGVVSADSTDYQTARTDATNSTDATVTDRTGDVLVVDRVTDRRTDAAAVDRATFERRLAARLAHFGLTDAQIREIVTGASRLREAGASRLVIRSSIVVNLYEFGVEAPFLHADVDDERPTDHPRLHRFIWNLDVTPEQARELHAVAHRMHEAGATDGEIRSAIRRMAASYDDEVDDHPDPVDRLVGSLVDRYDLDREQAAELERLIRGKVDDGADRTEIHGAVSRLLESYGIDPAPADALPRRPVRVTTASVR